MAKSHIVRPSKADLQIMRNLVSDMIQDKNRQGDYNADAPAIRLALNATLMLLKNELKEKPRGKARKRRS